MEKMFPGIRGTSFELGSKKVPVEEILRKFKPDGKERERYLEKQGISQVVLSRFEREDDLHSTAARVLERALDEAGILPSELDHLYGAIACPSEKRIIPGFAREVAYSAGLSHARTVDLGRGCVASLEALQAATDRLERCTQEGIPYAAAILGGENPSVVIDPDDFSTAFLFSDGIAAVVIANYGPRSHLIKKVDYRNLGPKDIGLQGKESELKPLIDSMTVSNPFVTQQREFFQMNGDLVYQFATRNALPIGLSLLSLSEIPDEAYLIPHQPSVRVLDRMISHARVQPDKVYTQGVRTIGNTGSATILIGLDETLRDEDLRKKDLLLFSFGTGPTVGAAYLQAVNQNEL